MSARIADITKVLKFLVRPQLKIWVKLEVLEALEELVEGFQIESLLDTIHGDYLFSKKETRELIINYFSDIEILERGNLMGLSDLTRETIQLNLEIFCRFMDLKYDSWKVSKKKKLISPGHSIGSFKEVIISNGVPHEYQLAAKRELVNWYNSDIPSTILFMPTGSGKTRTANELLVDLLRNGPRKCLWLTNRSELLVQSSNSFMKLWEEKGDHLVNVKYFFDDCDDWFAPNRDYSEIVYGGFQKLNSRLHDTQFNFDLVIIDEAHFSLADTYLPLINRMIRSGVKCLGLTATPMSSNDDEFQSIRSFFGTSIDLSRLSNGVYDFNYLQSNRYLAKIEYQHLNIEKVNFRWDSNRLNGTVLDFVKDIAFRKENVIIFAINKTHALLLVSYLKMNDVSAELIVGETDLKDREKYLKLFEDGDLTALVNHEILATGVDVPKLNSIMVLRDFGSENLSIQVVGRALRGTLNGGNLKNTVIFPNLEYTFDITKKY
tara:strand:+ start:4378 stop:5850 length:1473 start_codon:yes stop_codon:yes gene_type:complete